MPISEKEAIASFRILVALAKADGVLHVEERAASRELDADAAPAGENGLGRIGCEHAGFLC